MTKRGETDGFEVHDFVRVLEGALPRPLTRVVYNTKRMPSPLLSKYKKEGAYPVHVEKPEKNWIGADILSTRGGLARHHSDKIAKVIMSLPGV